MVLTLFLAALLVLSVDVFLTGTIVGFLQSKFSFKQLFKLQLVLAIIVSIVLLFGIILGKIFMSLYTNLAVWYASTILFILSLKLFYDGIRLHKLRRTINPLDSKGLLAIATFLCLNAFFIGLSFGFLNISNISTLYALLILIGAVIFGYISGFKLKKLIAIRVELYEAIIFFIMAIFIIIKL